MNTDISFIFIRCQKLDGIVVDAHDTAVDNV